VSRKQHPNDYEHAVIAVQLATGLRTYQFRLDELPRYSHKHHCYHLLCEDNNSGGVFLCGFVLYRRSYGNWRIAVRKYHPEFHRLSRIFETNALEKTDFSELTIAQTELQDPALWLALGKAFAALLRGQVPSTDGLTLAEGIGHFPGYAWTEAAWQTQQAGDAAEGRIS